MYNFLLIQMSASRGMPHCEPALTVLRHVFRTLAKWRRSPETSRPIRSPRNRRAPPGHLIYLFSVAFMQRIDSLKFLLFSVWFIARLLPVINKCSPGKYMKLPCLGSCGINIFWETSICSWETFNVRCLENK